jgi:hypothetical protein
VEPEESGFVIDGKVYEIPGLDTFTMDEAQILYDYAGLTLEDFAPADPEGSEDEKEEHDTEFARKLKNPGFLRTLMHVAYQRGNPKAPRARVKDLIGNANLVEALERIGEADESPPETSSQSEPSSQPPSSEPSRSADSGIPSQSDSDEPDESLEATGTTRSDTSSPPVAPIRSVA